MKTIDYTLNEFFLREHSSLLQFLVSVDLPTHVPPLLSCTVLILFLVWVPPPHDSEQDPQGNQLPQLQSLSVNQNIRYS